MKIVPTKCDAYAFLYNYLVRYGSEFLGQLTVILNLETYAMCVDCYMTFIVHQYINISHKL